MKEIKGIKTLPTTIQIAVALKNPEFFNDKEYVKKLLRVKNYLCNKLYKEYVNKRS